MSSSGDQKNADHNQGEQDASKGVHNPPFNAIQQAGLPASHWAERNSDYNKGHDNTTNQKK